NRDAGGNERRRILRWRLSEEPPRVRCDPDSLRVTSPCVRMHRDPETNLPLAALPPQATCGGLLSLVAMTRSTSPGDRS
ncbi:MAG: hypothetical protein LC772_09455, partial [Chloroflexi bacterium]|nr:hypothetical protein [Chloroflexota bacterium]